MTTLTELQEIFDNQIDQGNSVIDKTAKQILSKANNSKSLGELFQTILTILAADYKINQKIQSEILEYDYILNLIKLMNRKNKDYTTEIILTYQQTVQTFREKKINKILS